MGAIQHSFRRYEKKFLLTPEQYEAILPVLKQKMKEEIYGLHTVCSLYYDTEHYELIRRSIDAPIYKEKFRLRSYGVPTETDLMYAEIKKKYDGVVYKRRVEAHPFELYEFLNGRRKLAHDEQIQKEIHWFFRSYPIRPRVFIGYERRAFLGKEDPELRITFDWNIRWRTERLDLRYGDEGKRLLPKGEIVMEIKIAQAMPLWISALLSQNRIYPHSFSKYGTCYQTQLFGGI